MYKNAATLIIVILGYLKINIEVLDTNMELVESNDYRRLSKDDKDANKVLATMWGRVRFFFKDK